MRWREAAVLVVLGVGCGGSSRPARAPAPAPAPAPAADLDSDHHALIEQARREPTTDDKERAKSLYRQGAAAFKAGDYRGAVGYFEQAYRESGDSTNLFNLAQAHRQLGDCRSALFFYRAYLRFAGTEVKNRSLVESNIAELERECG